ncbi:24.6k hypothetical protein [Modified Vaccinia Ankara virus]
MPFLEYHRLLPMMSVYNNKYDIVKDKYMWCYSQVNKRYIGALLPMFECNEYLQIGDPIHDQEGNHISPQKLLCSKRNRVRESRLVFGRSRDSSSRT